MAALCCRGCHQAHLMYMRYSFVVCTYNGARTIETCLRSIYGQIRHGYTMEIVLAPNGITDDTIKIAESLRAEFEACDFDILNIKEIGKSRALEIAFDRCLGEYVVVIDDDNYLEDDWLLHVEKSIADDKFGGILGTASCLPGGLAGFIDPRLELHLRSYAVGFQRSDPLAPVQIAWGAGTVFKREIWNKLRSRQFSFIFSGRIGGNLIAGEDGEFCCAAAFLGYTINYTDSALLVHDISPKRLTHEYARRLARSEGIIMAVFYYYIECYRRETVVSVVSFLCGYMFKSIFRLIVALLRGFARRGECDWIELSRNWARLWAWSLLLTKRNQLIRQINQLLMKR